MTKDAHTNRVDERDEDEDERIDERRELAAMLEGNGRGVQKELATVVERLADGEDLSVTELNGLRTEVGELQSVVESIATEHCPDARPWEYAREFIPPDYREKIVAPG